MSSPKRKRRQGYVEVHPDAYEAILGNVPLAKLVGEWHVPKRYTAEIDDPAYPYNLRLSIKASGGHLECDRIEIWQRSGGSPIDGKQLRFPVAGMIHTTAVLAGVRVTRPGGGVRLQPIGDGKQLEQFFAGLRTTEPRKGHPVDTDTKRLAEVARIYRAAMPTGAPVQAVADHLKISRSHAGRLVGLARDDGKLPETTSGKAKA